MIRENHEQLLRHKQVISDRRCVKCFLNLKDEVQSTPTFRDAYEKVRNRITQFEKGKFKSEANNKLGVKRISGGGRKVVCTDIRKELFCFFY